MKDLTNDQLIELYHKKARQMSFHNAAEGPSWYQETNARLVCKEELKNVMSELKDRSMEIPKGDYLI